MIRKYRFVEYNGKVKLQEVLYSQGLPVTFCEVWEDDISERDIMEAEKSGIMDGEQILRRGDRYWETAYEVADEIEKNSS